MNGKLTGHVFSSPACARNSAASASRVRGAWWRSMASRCGDALGWGDISPVKRTVLEQSALVAPISPIPSPRQLRVLEELADTPSPGMGLDRSNCLGPDSAKNGAVISTGSDELDTLLGGGVETGTVTVVRGSAQAMLHLVCALSVTTQLPEAAPEATGRVPGRLYGMKLFGGANGKVMVIDTRGDYLDGRNCIYAVCHRFSLDPEAVLENITYTCTADKDRPFSPPAGDNRVEEEEQKAAERETDSDCSDDEDTKTEFSPTGFLLHYPGKQPAWTYPAPVPEAEPAPGSVVPWPDAFHQSYAESQLLDISGRTQESEASEMETAPWPASLGVAAQARRQREEEEAAEAATRRGLETLLSSSDEEGDSTPETKTEPEAEPDAQSTESKEHEEDCDEETPLDASSGAWQVELLQEAAELIVSEAGMHPSYRCLILMQPENFFEEWTEKSRDEVLDKLSDHATAVGCAVCFISSTEPAGGEVASTEEGSMDESAGQRLQGSEVAVCVRRQGGQCATEKTAVIHDLSVPTLALGPEQLHDVHRPVGTMADS